MRVLCTTAFVSALIAIAIACGGGSGSTTGATSQTSTSYCDSREARSKKCLPDGATPTTFNRGSCTEDYDCAIATLVNPDGYLSCRSNQDCNSGGDDECMRQSAGNRTVPLSDVCAKKYAECKAAGGKAFDDDTCPILNALNDATNDRIGTCFDKPCDQISDCIKVSYEAAAPACD